MVSHFFGSSDWKSIPELPDKPRRFISAEMHAQRVRARSTSISWQIAGLNPDPL